MDYTVLISNVTIKAEYSMFGTSIGELLCLTEALTGMHILVIAIVPGDNDCGSKNIQRIVPQNYACALNVHRRPIL